VTDTRRKPRGWWVCVRKGWYCYWDDRYGWVPCDKDHPGARPDLNRYTLWVQTGRPE
jgi:hypothetical protein